MPDQTPSTAITSTHVAAATEFLHGHGVAFDVVEHPHTESARAEAAVTGRPATQFGKTVVLQDGAAYVLTVIPASERLDLKKVRDLLGAGSSLRLADEEEMAADFPSIQVGAVPPAGPGLPMAEVVDHRLLKQPRILCPGGDHRHSILIDPRDLVRLSGAKVADICKEL